MKKMREDKNYLNEDTKYRGSSLHRIKGLGSKHNVRIKTSVNFVDNLYFPKDFRIMVFFPKKNSHTFLRLNLNNRKKGTKTHKTVLLIF